MRIRNGRVYGRSTNDALPIDSRTDDIADIAREIESDFRNLVKALNRAIQVAGDGDDELSLRLWRTKAVAQRGVRLGRLLRSGSKTR